MKPSMIIQGPVRRASIVVLLDASGMRMLRTSQCSIGCSKLHSTIVQHHVVNAWNHLDGQCYMRQVWARKRMMDLKTWDSWSLLLSQYQNTTLQAILEQCMSFHIGINSRSILQA
jgi:hypothetical protein